MLMEHSYPKFLRSLKPMPRISAHWAHTDSSQPNPLAGL